MPEIAVLYNIKEDLSSSFHKVKLLVCFGEYLLFFPPKVTASFVLFCFVLFAKVHFLLIMRQSISKKCRLTFFKMYFSKCT